jgi:hypothetical protein
MVSEESGAGSSALDVDPLSAQRSELFTSSHDFHGVKKPTQCPRGGSRPGPSESSKAGQDCLRLVQVDGRYLAAVTSVPAQGCPFVQIGIVVTEE